MNLEAKDNRKSEVEILKQALNKGEAVTIDINIKPYRVGLSDNIMSLQNVNFSPGDCVVSTLAFVYGLAVQCMQTGKQVHVISIHSESGGGKFIGVMSYNKELCKINVGDKLLDGYIINAVEIVEQKDNSNYKLIYKEGEVDKDDMLRAKEEPK